MADRIVCGTGVPLEQLPPGEREAVEEFVAYLEARTALDDGRMTRERFDAEWATYEAGGTSTAAAPFEPPDPALFDATPYEVEPTPTPQLNPDQRRKRRHAELMAAGLHPLSYYAPFGRLRLHPDAAPPDDRAAPGLRCGGCAHRQLMDGYHAGRFPKCMRLSTSNSASSDCRAWWPACHKYKPKRPAKPAEGGDAHV